MFADGALAFVTSPREIMTSVRVDRRLACAITIAFCLAFPASGIASQQPETSAPGNTTSQAPAPGAPPTEPSAEQKSEPKKETPTEPRTEQTPEPKKETPTEPHAEQTPEPKKETPTEPRAEQTPELKKETQTEPQTEPKTEPKTVPTKRDDESAVSPNVRRPAGKGASPMAPDGTPRKIVVRQGGVDEPKAQIVTGMTSDEANRQRQDAEQLLKSTVETLERIDPHALDRQQQETVSQIHNYMEGARSALKEGDISRGHTLAVKAALLAEDLAKH